MEVLVALVVALTSLLRRWMAVRLIRGVLFDEEYKKAILEGRLTVIFSWPGPLAKKVEVRPPERGDEPK